MVETHDVCLVSDALINGEVVILQTDTLFGIACNMYNVSAVEKVYKVKNRPKTQPLSIAVCDISHIYKFTKNVHSEAKKFIEEYFPGKVTVVLESNELVPDEVNSESGYIGVRVPDCEPLLNILKGLDFPIVLTSANIHGCKNCSSIGELNSVFGSDIDYIYTFSDLVCKSEGSTVVKFCCEKMSILRIGDIKNL